MRFEYKHVVVTAGLLLGLVGSAAPVAAGLVTTCGDTFPQCDGNCPAGSDCRLIDDSGNEEAKQGGGAGDPNGPIAAECACVPLGACCRIDGDCIEGPADECLGTYLGDGTTCALAECSAPPDGGYDVTECDDPFENIAATGTALALGDDTGVSVPIGFSFAFFGFIHANIGVASNGYLSFGGHLSNFSNDLIPDTDTPNDLIAPLWDDFDPPNGGTVHRQTLGAAPNRRFIAQWTDVPQFATGDSNTFQAVLYEGTNVIQFRYGEFTPEAFAGDYTVGIENPTGTTGIGVPASLLMPGDCLEFSPLSQPVAPAQAVPAMSYAGLAAATLMLIGLATRRLTRVRLRAAE